MFEKRLDRNLRENAHTKEYVIFANKGEIFEQYELLYKSNT